MIDLDLADSLDWAAFAFLDAYEDLEKKFVVPGIKEIGDNAHSVLEIVDEIEKHLPMQHNQKAHGRSGQVSVEIESDSAEFYDVASKKIFGKVIPIETLGDIYSGGLDRLPKRAKIKIEINTADDIEVDGKIILDGKSIGKFTRFFSRGRSGIVAVEHAHFFMGEKYQGSGYGSEMFFHSEDAYKKLGVDRIGITANADVGGYAWARMGFEFADIFGRNSIASDFTNVIVDRLFETRDSLQGVGHEIVQLKHDLNKFFKTEEDRTTHKKDFEKITKQVLDLTARQRVLETKRRMLERGLTKVKKFKYPFQFAAYKLEYDGKILVDGKQLMKRTEWTGVKYPGKTRGPSNEAANVFRRLIGEKKLAWKKRQR